MKFVRVNMTTQAITSQDAPADYRTLGGRGLTSTLIYREVPPKCDPLGPENKLVFAPGFLGGLSLVNTSRVSIGAKSPLTGGIKESNAGGKMGTALGGLGLAALIVEGQARSGACFIIVIDEKGRVRLEDGQKYRGARTYALAEDLFRVYGPDNAVMCIGPAGEHLLSSASIQSTDVDGRPCRSAGRGGLGAVMGAKGLKALVVSEKGGARPELADPLEFKEAAKVFAQAVMESPFSGKILRAQGTAVLVGPLNAIGAFPCYNATRGYFDEWNKISGDALAEMTAKRGGQMGHQGCSRCIVHCSNIYQDAEGRYVTGSLEYETIWALGAMLGLSDLDAIAKLDFLCDDIGLDTMNAGTAMAVAMDAGRYAFGDAEAAVDLLEQAAAASEMGRLIGNGPEAVGRYFHHHRVPACKGQSIAAYDPRGLHGNAVTYATSPQGADHTAGNTLSTNLAAFGGKLDPTQPDGQIEASRKAQISVAALDCTGLCLFVGGALAGPKGGEAFHRLLKARFGEDLGPDFMPRLGRTILAVEFAFNRSAGLTPDLDRLPEFFYREPLPPNNSVVLLNNDDLARAFADLEPI
ncbi:MAG: aldehyde ferredoxin oxidoreductase C-terminal domain-containing protein [Thermodesulfobacteriota bacterium]